MAKQQPVRKIREEMNEAVDATPLKKERLLSVPQQQNDRRGPEWHRIQAEKAAQQQFRSDL